MTQKTTTGLRPHDVIYLIRWLNSYFVCNSQVAETGKSGFRSGHELEKVLTVDFSDQYLLSKAHYVVKSKSGVRSERKEGLLLRHPFAGVKTRL